MAKPHLGSMFFSLFSLLSFLVSVQSQSSSTDASVMQDLKTRLNPPSSLGWTDSNPCNWQHVACSSDGRVTRIQIGHQNLQGSLPPSINDLTALLRFEVMSNQPHWFAPEFCRVELAPAPRAQQQLLFHSLRFPLRLNLSPSCISRLQPLFGLANSGYFLRRLDSPSLLGRFR
ncbi:hypothetical protein ACSBR1_040052 [Camellia fascicularis]